MAVVGTLHLTPGDVVYTTGERARDFDIPLVEPTRRKRGRCARMVRNVVKCQGGVVVFFADGHKSRPVHGRTGWLRSDPDLLTEVR